MRRGVATVIAGVALMGSIAAQARDAGPDDPDFLTVGAGGFAVASHDTAGEFVLQYRSDRKLAFLKPHAGLMATSDGGVYGFAGVLVDVYFGNRLVLTPSVAAGGYHEGDGKDLGHAIEFRSGAELAYRFDDRSRLGVGFYHMSNFGIGDENPGAESALLTYSLPLATLLGR